MFVVNENTFLMSDKYLFYYGIAEIWPLKRNCENKAKLETDATKIIRGRVVM